MIWRNVVTSSRRRTGSIRLWMRFHLTFVDVVGRFSLLLDRKYMRFYQNSKNYISNSQSISPTTPTNVKWNLILKYWNNMYHVYIYCVCVCVYVPIIRYGNVNFDIFWVFSAPRVQTTFWVKSSVIITSIENFTAFWIVFPAISWIFCV